MARIVVELPDSVVAWIEEEVVGQGDRATVGEYIIALINEDIQRRSGDFSVEELREIIDDAEASGISSRTPREIFEEVRQRVRRGA